jgi:predicted transcriptional regulator
MTVKRKSSSPLPEHGIFTDELAGPSVARIESEAAFFARVRRRAKAGRRGNVAGSVASVSFESVGALLAVLTPKRYALFEAVKEHGGFESIEALASTLRRDRATVSRDLRALSDAGLVLLRDAVSPGHGRRTEIAPVAERVMLALEL